MNAKALLKKQWDEDPILHKFKRSNTPWGDYVEYHSPKMTPPLPSTASRNSRMVWNPEVQRYVLAAKRFNYVPDLKFWISKDKANQRRKAEQNRTRRSLSPATSNEESVRRSRQTRQTRKTRKQTNQKA